jgi:hypothetical protein
MKNTLHLSEKKSEIIWITGLVSQEEGYQLCLNLNKQLGFKFSLADSIHAGEVTFAHFTYTDEGNVTYHLIENRNFHAFLIGTLKNIDYLFLVKDKLAVSKQQAIVMQIKKITNVQAVPIPIDKIKKAIFLESI